MSLEAVQKLSIPELLQVLGEKLGEEYSRVRGIPPSSTLLASLEPEIESLETWAHDILRFLPTLRNTLQPVNRLPPEIISYVARCALNDNDRDASSIIPLTHVCRYWRDSIVSTPENWALICNERKRMAQLSLERSKAAPLVVFLVFRMDREFLNLLLPHVQRITSLSCDGFYTLEELGQTFPNFPKSMPNIRSLVLKNGSGPATQNHSVDPFHFSAHTTTLTELSLSYVPLFPSILSLKTLTKFTLDDPDFNLHIDTFLDFLEANHSLETADITIEFADAALRLSHRRKPIRTRLQHLSIAGFNGADIQTLLSGIALQKGATLSLKVYPCGEGAGLTRIFSGVSMAHFPNISSSTFMEYKHSPRKIQLRGPNGSFLFDGHIDSETSFQDFPLLPLSSIRELRLECRRSWILTDFRLSLFPSLEVLAIDGGSSISFFPHEQSTSGSTPSPLLKTLAFLDCVITEDFMAILTRVAIHRKRGPSTSLQRVVIINSKGQFIPEASIESLMEHVPVVELLYGREFPKDLV